MSHCRPPLAPEPSRRLICLAAVAGVLTPDALAQAASTPTRAPIVTILGDSITAGLGLHAADALPAQLQDALGRRGSKAVVRGAGVSGDTSADGLARLAFSVQPDTTVCVVELGGNDYLQSIDPADTARNLAAIVDGLKARGVGVVLVSGSAPAHASGSYGREFDAIFRNLAAHGHVVLAPDLFAGVAGRPDLRQADGLHPNAQGVRVIAERLAPSVLRALAVSRPRTLRR